MKRILLFLLLVPLAFAAWQSVAALAIGVSVTILAVIYMVGMGFGINELQIMAKEEFFQLIAVGVLVVALISADGILNAISTTPAFLEGSATTMQETARNMLDASMDSMKTILRDIQKHDKEASIESSRAMQCSIMGMGYSISSCGSYSMLATPLSMAGGIVGFGIGELSAISRLILISETYALSLLLPLGIVLRTLKITRGAGGLLIALGISLHIMLPMGIIFTEMLGAKFLNPNLDDIDAVMAAIEYAPAIPLQEVEFDCDPADPGGGNTADAVNAYRNMRSNIRRYLYVALIKATLGPVLALLIMASSIRALTSIAGAEVDVSAISRFV